MSGRPVQKLNVFTVEFLDLGQSSCPINSNKE